MSEKLHGTIEKINSEFLKPCFVEEIRKNWSLKFGRTGVDHKIVYNSRHKNRQKYGNVCGHNSDGLSVVLVRA